MPGRGSKRSSNRRLTASVITGLILVPLSAIAAVALVGVTSRPPAADALDATTSAPTSTTSTIAFTLGGPAADIDSACTTDAASLVEGEITETNSELQAAALDALREICAEHGIPIAGPPAPDPVIEVVTIASPSPATTTTTEDVVEDDHEDDDDREDHEDDHDHGEDHEDDHDDHGEEDD